MGSSDIPDMPLSLKRKVSVKKKRSSKKWMWILASVAIVFLVTLGIRLYHLHRYHFEKQTHFMMDTYVTVYAVGPKSITVPAINLAFDRMQEVNVKFNSRNPDSPIYSFNEKGVPISDPEILDLVRIALQVADDSDGAFDITVAPLIALWGFYGDTPRLPKDDEIKRCLENIGFHHLLLSDRTLEKKKAGVKIDLGGIAKGYAVAQAVSILRQKGVTSALIDAGGDIHALGKKGRFPWKVGLKHPRKDGILGFIEVEDLSVMGSGDYERFFMKEGKRYHHIFNPKTGYPVEGLLGSTLVHPNPILADAWNTAIYVLGADEGMRRVEEYSGMAALMVKDSGEILYSTGLKNALTIPEDR
ncbi:MAG: FAD:protein FMN transferase [Desulfobacterales bacterium]|nr:FAD:protein FMN transferase [Desulfobacterales bacterium]